MADKQIKDMTDDEWEDHLNKTWEESDALGDEPDDGDIIANPNFLGGGVRPRDYPDDLDDDE